MRLLFFSLLAAAVLTCADAAEPSVDPVLACMRANIPKTLRIEKVELTYTDRGGGERRMRGRLFAEREDDLLRALLRIDAPADLARSAYLLRESGDAGHGDEMYLYLPALNRVRRITGAGADSSLFGTDLSYSDLKELHSAFSGGSVTLDASAAPVAGRPVYGLTVTPRTGETSRYTRIHALIDQKTCVALIVEFDEPAGLRKRLTVSPESLKQSSGHWYASEALIEDLTEHTHTRLRVLGVEDDVNLPGRYFDPHGFYLGG